MNNLKKNNLMARQEKQLLVLSNNVLSEEITHSDIKDIGITQVEISTDYEQAILYYDTLSNNETLKKALEATVPFIRKRIASSLKFRKVPKIIFKFDNLIQQVKKMDDIFDKIKK